MNGVNRVVSGGPVFEQARRINALEVRCEEAEGERSALREKVSEMREEMGRMMREIEILGNAVGVAADLLWVEGIDKEGGGT